MLRHLRAITVVTLGVVSLAAQESSTPAVTVAETVKKLGVDTAGLSTDLLGRRFLGSPELATGGHLGFAGWLAPTTIRDQDVLLVAIHRPGEVWKSTTLPLEAAPAIARLGSPTSLASVGAHVVLSTHAPPITNQVTVICAPMLKTPRVCLERQ